VVKLDIVQIIKSLLPLKGLKSIAELEKACGISNGTIGKWGAGAYSPTMRNLEKIAEYLEVSTDVLLGKSPPPYEIDEENDETKKAAPEGERPEREVVLRARGVLSDLMDDEIQEVLRYAEYVKSQRNQ
jgi:transcriptional regulator with XRE-family HTH domain